VAIGDPYATEEDLKVRMGVPAADTGDDARFTQAVLAASRGIERVCKRQFNRADAATARTLYPTRDRLVICPDFHTADGLVVQTDSTGDGTFDTTIAIADLQPEPLDNVQDGIEGWPYWRIKAVGGTTFPRLTRASVRVTAQWGWAAVPADIKEATQIAAAELWKLKDAPLGVTGQADWGMIRVRDNPKVYSLIAPYARSRKRVS
jgi:hypothetical protein